MKSNKDELTISNVKFDNEADFNKVMLTIAMNHEEGYVPTDKVIELLKQKVEKGINIF